MSLTLWVAVWTVCRSPRRAWRALRDAYTTPDDHEALQWP